MCEEPSVDIRASRSLLNLSQTQLAAMFKVDLSTVVAWESGTKAMPGDKRAMLASYVAAAEREKKLVAAGHPPCAEAEALFPLTAAEIDDKVYERYMRELDRHEATCSKCIARQQYEKEHLGPPPLPPLPGLLGVLQGTVTSIPEPLRSMLIGAAGPGLIVGIRNLVDQLSPAKAVAGPYAGWIVFLLPMASGAFAGAVFSMAHRRLREVPTIGPYLAATVVAGAFVLPLSLLSPHGGTTPEKGVLWRLGWGVAFAVAGGLAIGQRTRKLF